MYCFTTGKHFEQWHFESKLFGDGKHMCPHCKQEWVDGSGYEDTHGQDENMTFTQLWEWNDILEKKCVEVGKIGNAYADGLSVVLEGGKAYWSIRNYDGHTWEEISVSLYNELIKQKQEN